MSVNFCIKIRTIIINARRILSRLCHVTSSDVIMKVSRSRRFFFVKRLDETFFDATYIFEITRRIRTTRFFLTRYLFSYLLSSNKISSNAIDSWIIFQLTLLEVMTLGWQNTRWCILCTLATRLFPPTLAKIPKTLIRPAQLAHINPFIASRVFQKNVAARSC